MNKIFNFKRFGKFFAFDARTAAADWGVSFLVMALMPAIWFVLYEVLQLVTKGAWRPLPDDGKLPIFMVTMIVGMISFPVRHYGFITDKRRGSDWLLIPASSFEKFLSLLLMCCVVVPVALVGVYTICDLLMTIFPAYGDVSYRLSDAFRARTFSDGNSLLSLSVCPAFIFWLNWCENTLIFALGAVLFRKAKIPYTILSVFGIILVLITIFGLIIGNTSFDLDLFDLGEDITAGKAATLVNVFVNVVYLVVFTVLDLGIYFRIKTIKQ